MPVSPHGFEAWVEVEGARLQEFNVQPHGDKILCWVPCEAGKEFKIGCTVPLHRLRTTNHSIFAYLDGIGASLASNVVRQNPFTIDPETRLFSEELVRGAQAMRAFQFGSLELTDDDTLLNAPVKQFGEIAVTFNSVEAYVQVYTTNGSKWKDDYRAHERSKKGVSHCVKLGEEKPRAAGLKHHTAIGARRLCTIIFKYRPMDVLVAYGIVPGKQMSPIPTIADRSSGSLTSVRTASLKRRMAEVKQEDRVPRDLTYAPNGPGRVEFPSLKDSETHGSSSVSQRPIKRVKREPNNGFGSREIIDLTNPSSENRFKYEPRGSFQGEVIDLT